MQNTNLDLCRLKRNVFLMETFQGYLLKNLIKKIGTYLNHKNEKYISIPKFNQRKNML